MPIITIQLFPGRTKEMKERAALKITKIIVEELKAKKEDVLIIYQDMEKENWFKDGQGYQ